MSSHDTPSDHKTSNEFLIVCAHCKKIRDNRGYWKQIESFMREHFIKVKFSHSLCPECAAELYPEFYRKDI